MAHKMMNKARHGGVRMLSKKGVLDENDWRVKGIVELRRQKVRWIIHLQGQHLRNLNTFVRRHEV